MKSSLLTTTFLLVIIGYFAGPWVIAERRNCIHKKFIKISSVIAPLLMLFPAASFTGWLFYIPTLLLYIGAVVDKKSSN